jgi:hypothetical protein
MANAPGSVAWAPGVCSEALRCFEPPKPRLKAIDRQQMRLHPVEVERLVEADQAVRAIWELIGPGFTPRSRRSKGWPDERRSIRDC